ncbi:MAG: hypothetical protein RBS68_13940 [Anaerolineales bacterium]|jgi:hypothetical protein|nr:hypothetical protein [Anaerolineales bacterium]
MKQPYHLQITRAALQNLFAPAALQEIINANLKQDALKYQIGHDHFHFDNNSFAASHAYLAACRKNALNAIRRQQPALARAEFGRLTHTVQDFYAHTNYTSLWRELHPQAAPDQIDPVLDSCLKNPRLHSGRLYYPLEILYFVPFLSRRVLPHLPPDSHAHMNKDDPSRPDFEYARWAATYRTQLEWLSLAESLSPAEQVTFLGQANSAEKAI